SGTDDLEGARRLHQAVHRQPDDRDALAVAEHLGRERLAGLELEIDDQVGHHDHGIAVDPQDEVFVLDGDAGFRPGPSIAAGEHPKPALAPISTATWRAKRSSPNMSTTSLNTTTLPFSSAIAAGADLAP